MATSIIIIAIILAVLYLLSEYGKHLDMAGHKIKINDAGIYVDQLVFGGTDGSMMHISLEGHKVWLYKKIDNGVCSGLKLETNSKLWLLENKNIFRKLCEDFDLQIKPSSNDLVDSEVSFLEKNDKLKQFVLLLFKNIQNSHGDFLIIGNNGDIDVRKTACHGWVSR